MAFHANHTQNMNILQTTVDRSTRDEVAFGTANTMIRPDGLSVHVGRRSRGQVKCVQRSLIPATQNGRQQFCAILLCPLLSSNAVHIHKPHNVLPTSFQSNGIILRLCVCVRLLLLLLFCLRTPNHSAFSRNIFCIPFWLFYFRFTVDAAKSARRSHSKFGVCPFSAQVWMVFFCEFKWRGSRSTIAYRHTHTQRNGPPTNKLRPEWIQQKSRTRIRRRRRE